VAVSSALALYRRLPEEARRCLRPLNLVDELASALPGRLRTPVETATELLRRVRRLRRTVYPLRRLSGPSRVGGFALSCLLAADDLSVRYWGQTLFAVPPLEARLGEVRALDVRAAAAELAATADLSLWQTSWPFWAAARGAARVPAWIPLGLATDRPLEAIVHGERSGRAARKNDIRRIDRLGVTVRVTRDARVWEDFRRRLYEPYVTRRFADLAVPVPRHVFRHVRRRGWLLLLEREARPIAGAVLERVGRDVRVVVFGADLGADVAPTTGIEACYYHAIRFAVGRGFHRLGLGTCRPVLTDGVLRYKRKWGAALDRPNTWDAWFLRYRHTPAVRAALTGAPILVDRGGRLVALAGVEESGLEAQLERIEAPGLDELACLVDDGALVPDVVPRHAALRIVPPGEVWPREATAAA